MYDIASIRICAASLSPDTLPIASSYIQYTHLFYDWLLQVTRSWNWNGRPSIKKEVIRRHLCSLWLISTASRVETSTLIVSLIATIIRVSMSRKVPIGVSQSCILVQRAIYAQSKIQQISNPVVQPQISSHLVHNAVTNPIHPKVKRYTFHSINSTAHTSWTGYKNFHELILISLDEYSNPSLSFVF